MPQGMRHLAMQGAAAKAVHGFDEGPVKYRKQARLGFPARPGGPRTLGVNSRG